MPWWKRIAAEAKGIWRKASIWLKLALLWLVVMHSLQFAVKEMHANSPGPYNAPHKVKVRKNMVLVRSLGVTALFSMSMLTLADRRPKHKTKVRGRSSGRE